MRFWISTLVFGFATQASAIVPPQALKNMRSRASDVVRIQVMDFQESPSEHCPSPCAQHDIKAKVVSVVRSRAGLEAGQVIQIRYTYRPLKSGQKGAKPTIAPPEGSKSCAYLSGTVEDGFSPVARSKSFPRQCD